MLKLRVLSLKQSKCRKILQRLKTLPWKKIKTEKLRTMTKFKKTMQTSQSRKMPPKKKRTLQMRNPRRPRLRRTSKPKKSP